MTVTEVQFKKTKKQKNGTDQLFAPNHWFLELIEVHLAQSTSLTSPLLPVSCLFCCCHPGFPTETQRGPALPRLRPFAHAVVHCLEYSTHGSWQAYSCSFLGSQLPCSLPGQSKFPVKVSVRAFHFSSSLYVTQFEITCLFFAFFSLG